MDSALSQSAFLRFLLVLGACYNDSRLRRVFLAIGRVWTDSATGRFFIARLSAEPATSGSSRYRRWLLRRNERLHSLSGAVPVWQGSLLYRIYAVLMAWGRGSRIFGWLFRGGMREILLFILALYALVDYVLRSVLSVPVLSSTWDELLLAAAFLWIVKERIDSKSALAPRVSPIEAPMLLFLGIGFGLMFAVSPFFSIAVAGYRATVEYMLWFLLALRLIRSDRDFLVLYLSMIGLAFAIALHGVYQYIAAVPIPSSWVTSTETAVRTRVYSIFGSPNIMGDYLVMFAPMAAALAYCVKDWRLKCLCWAAALTMCLSCLFTMSRGAWVGLAVAILLFALMQDRRILVLMLLAAIVAACLPFVSSRIGFLFTDQYAAASSRGGRASRWAIGMQYLTLYSNPLLGFGLGMFGGAVAMQNKVYSWISYFYMDNYYLKILVEMGYIGFASYVFLLLSWLWTSLRSVFRAKKQKSSLSPLNVGMVSGLCGVLVHCYFENIFEQPYMMAYFWTIAAMIVYLGFVRKETPERESGAAC